MRIKKPGKYPFEIRSLNHEEGGGFLVSYPDFDECIADGETREEALQNGRQALADVIATLKELRLPIPRPGKANHDYQTK